ncbi:MAG TPA: DUF3616 domain-containing protein [Blastocatellia bacterium]|nr:DUF3616 domain-containing protein [Blastocatellia bacterium]
MTLECPQCKSPVAREGQRFCYRCGNDLRSYYDSLNIQLKDAKIESSAQATGASETPVRTLEVPEQQNQSPPIKDKAALGKQAAAAQTSSAEITEDTYVEEMMPGRKATLRVLLPTGDVFDREITQAETQIGKGPRNDIVIADPAVSTAHALLRSHEGKYTIADIGSRNGTFVNGEKIGEPRTLQHGDVIGMGLSKLTFRLSGQTDTSVINITEALTAKPSQPLTEQSLAAAIIAAGLATQSDVDRLRGADSQGRRLYRALVEDGLVGEEKLRDLMSRHFEIPTINLKAVKIDKAIAASISPQLAREHQVFAVTEESGNVILAVADPTDTAAVETVKREVKKPVMVRLATASEILEQIDRHFGPRLIGVLPTGEKVEYFISQKEIEIGKAAHNHIVLSDATVSNTHAIILARDGGYSIVDLGSRNGTFVNGERLGTHARTLRHGDAIQLGKTILTFRNRAETAENVTATLSVEAIEEVRRRAALNSNRNEASTADAGRPTAEPFAAVAPPANVAPQPLSGPQAVSPVVATPQPIAPAEAESEEEKEKKKKKKKKKKDDRLKAAYIGGLSRIVAQVIAVLLSVGLALYIANRSMSPGEKPIETTAKGKPKIKVSDAGAGARIAGPLARYEASGAVFVPDSDRVYFVVNDSPQLFWMKINESGQLPNTQAGSVDIKAVVADAEGITYDGHFLYIVGSQSQPGEGNSLVRFLFDPTSESVRDEPETVTDLRGLLLEKVDELRDVGGLDKNSGGLNIEGIAWDDRNKRLLLGLRSPVRDGKALIIPLKIADPRKMTRETLQLAGSAIKLSLENLGIRDIQYDPRSESFFIIAGPSVRDGGFSLWQWYANDEQANGEPNPRKLTDLDASIKPEGVTRVHLGGRDYVFIIGDAGSYKMISLTESQ